MGKLHPLTLNNIGCLSETMPVHIPDEGRTLSAAKEGVFFRVNHLIGSHAEVVSITPMYIPGLEMCVCVFV